MKGQRKFWTLLLARSCVVCQAAWDVALLNYNVIRYFMPEIKQKLRFYFWRVYVRIISCSLHLSPDIILHGWLGLKHQLTNFPAPAQWFPWLNLWVNQSLNYFGDTEAENKACRGQIWWLKCLSPWELVWFKSRSLTHGDWLRNKSKRGWNVFKCANSHTCQFSLSLSPLSLSLSLPEILTSKCFSVHLQVLASRMCDHMKKVDLFWQGIWAFCLYVT